MTLYPNERLDDLQLNNLFIIQNKEEYLFTSDAIALANFVKVSKGGRVVDLCSGSGVIGILVQAKNNTSKVVLVEIQKYMADMSQRTIQYNKLKNIEVINNKLQNVHKMIGAGYDVVVCNPPYKKANTTKFLSEKKSIAIAKHEVEVTLEEIILESNKLLKYGGELYLVNKEERLVDILTLCRKYDLEPKELKVLPSAKGANVIMLRCKKGGRGGMKISLCN